jgi:hypothetical protein
MGTKTKIPTKKMSKIAKVRKAKIEEGAKGAIPSAGKPSISEVAERASGKGTIAAMAEGYLKHLEDAGNSSGTIFSYRLELQTAISELGAETPIALLTTDSVQKYFESDRVMKKRSGKAKARPTFLKTQRVLRLALGWAQEAGMVEKAPIPETVEAS